MTLAGFRRKMVIAILVYAGLFIVANIVFHFVRNEGPTVAFLPFLVGALFGAELNVLKMVWLERVVHIATEENSMVSPWYVHVQYLFRWLLTGALIVLAVVFANVISVVGVAAGIMTMPLAGYTVGIFTGNKNPVEAKQESEKKPV